MNVSQPTSRDWIYVVSGLSDSGMCMLLQVLSAGGLEVLRDHVQSRSNENPGLAYAHDQASGLFNGDVNWIWHARGKVIQVNYSLLPYLVEEHFYKVLFVTQSPEPGRPIGIYAKMSIPNYDGIQEKSKGEERDENKLLAHIILWLVQQIHMQVLFINGDHILHHPREYFHRISRFLQCNLDIHAMLESLQHISLPLRESH